jgi:excisionase family DNA binding protein
MTVLPDAFWLTTQSTVKALMMVDSVKTPWMTPLEAAAYLRVSLGTLRNWTSARYVPFVRRGRVVRYRRDDLDEWLSKDRCDGRLTIADLAATRLLKSSTGTSP